MLKKIEFDNFKSFEGKETINLEDLTTIIGLNSSGKTNILEGISILSNISSGVDITAYFNKYSKNSKESIRGGALGCCRARKKTFGLGCTIEKNNGHLLVYYLKIDASNEDRVYVDEENLYEFNKDGRRTTLFKTIKKEKLKGDIIVEYNNKKRGINPRIQCDRSYSILSQLKENTLRNYTLAEIQILLDNSTSDFKEITTLEELNTNENSILEDIKLVQKHIGNVRTVEPIPDKIREYVSRESTDLYSDASNLSAVLHTIIQRYQDDQKRLIRAQQHLDELGADSPKHIWKIRTERVNDLKIRYKISKEKYDSLLSIIQLLPEYQIEGLDTLVTPAPLRDVMFTCIEKGNDTNSNFKIPASLLSDGTLKTIAIATALVTYPEKSIILLDEFDSGTHHNKSVALLKELYRISKKRNIILVVTTHNTTLLNNYTNHFLQGTSVVYRDKKSYSSKIINFYNLYDVEKLLARGGLGDAARKDGLTKYLHPEPKKDISLPDWLLEGSKEHE
ncbi:AAA15 family ATPase/GTPase [Enterococcus rotai]|uniref:AAA family ATPase n=1 Tax=Enterococcus rotai TaxID=118060 RepID=UPI00339AFD52